MPDDVEKRLRYFNGQFLQAQDFIQEQAYHIDRQRRHNRQLHTPGIADGLSVTADVGAAEIEVTPGTAVDGEGRQMVLTSSRRMNVSTHANQTILLVISYEEESSDEATVGGEEDTRWHERPRLEVFPEDSIPPGDTHIRLARLAIGAEGTVSEHDDSARINAGVRLGGELELRRLTLSQSGIDPSQWPTLRSDAAGRVDVAGSLRVSEELIVGGTIQAEMELVASGTISIRAGQEERVPLGNLVSPVWIDAHSTTPNAMFSWTQGSRTDQNGKVEQFARFRYMDGPSPIEVNYQIFRLLRIQS